jgi:hypothetical protein
MEKARTQLSFRMALGQQLIGTYRGSRKRKLVSVVDNCGNTHWSTKFEKKGRCKIYRSKQNQNRYFHHLRAFLQVEYCILIWSALSTPSINLVYAVATLGHGTSFKVPIQLYLKSLQKKLSIAVALLVGIEKECRKL